jgi:hypothetical protein
LQDASSKVAEQTDLNILKWEYTVVPNSTREITYSFIIEYPRDVIVSGLMGIE